MALKRLTARLVKSHCAENMSSPGSGRDAMFNRTAQIRTGGFEREILVAVIPTGFSNILAARTISSSCAGSGLAWQKSKPLSCKYQTFAKRRWSQPVRPIRKSSHLFRGAMESCLSKNCGQRCKSGCPPIPCPTIFFHFRNYRFCQTEKSIGSLFPAKPINDKGQRRGKPARPDTHSFCNSCVFGKKS